MINIYFVFISFYFSRIHFGIFELKWDEMGFLVFTFLAHNITKFFINCLNVSFQSNLIQRVKRVLVNQRPFGPARE